MAFSKQCHICKIEFTSLEDYMKHIKEFHKDIRPDKFTVYGNEQKWGFRQH